MTEVVIWQATVRSGHSRGLKSPSGQIFNSDFRRALPFPQGILPAEFLYVESSSAKPTILGMWYTDRPMPSDLAMLAGEAVISGGRARFLAPR